MPACGPSLVMNEHVNMCHREDVLTFSVHPRLVELLLTGVDVHPSFLVLAVNLDPNVIFTVPDPPHSRADSSTEHAEAVCEFPNSSFSSLQQRPDIGVSRKALVRTATWIAAAVKLNLGCSSCSFVICPGGIPLSDGRPPTCLTCRIGDEGKELALKPAKITFQ
jgi:hypothetical protein